MTSPLGRGLRALIPAAIPAVQARTAGDTTMLLPSVGSDASASAPTSAPTCEPASALEDQALEDHAGEDQVDAVGAVQLDRSIIASAAAVLADVAAGGSTRDVRYLAGALADLLHQAAIGPTRTTTVPPGGGSR